MTDRPGLSVRSSFRLGMNRVLSLPAPAPAIEIVPRISSFVHWRVFDRVGMKLEIPERPMTIPAGTSRFRRRSPTSGLKGWAES